MINKRGLSPEEFKQVDDTLLNYLLVYDALVEPSGTKIDMLYHAHLCQTLTLNNPNMTKEHAKNIKTSDYDFLGILGEGTTQERKNSREKEKEAVKKQSTQDYFTSRMSTLKGKDNGK
ncbi:hypothetical protein F3J34_11360 [Klebsiella sp. Ap-873]|nr:hypothetical protein [Klebsiella sp. Ap-873]